MPPDLLVVPAFARLHDWYGVWAIEPLAWEALRSALLRMDLPAHILAAAPRPANAELLTRPVPAKGGKTVSVIDVAGPLMKSRSSVGGTSTVQLRKELRAATNDPNVHAIVMDIDSPGGTVSGLHDAADDVARANRKKPVYAHVNDLAASAAYWLGSQAGMVYAGNPMTQVGSIGTYFAIQDLSKAAEKEGVETFLATTGPLKGIGVPGTRLTDEHKVHLQAKVNEAQAYFDAAVKKGRGMNQAQLQAVRSGAVFPAAEAVGLRLIDGIQSLDKTVEAAAAAA